MCQDLPCAEPGVQGRGGKKGQGDQQTAEAGSHPTTHSGLGRPRCVSGHRGTSAVVSWATRERPEEPEKEPQRLVPRGGGGAEGPPAHTGHQTEQMPLWGPGLLTTIFNRESYARIHEARKNFIEAFDQSGRNSKNSCLEGDCHRPRMFDLMPRTVLKDAG